MNKLWTFYKYSVNYLLTIYEQKNLIKYTFYKDLNRYGGRKNLPNPKPASTPG